MRAITLLTAAVFVVCLFLPWVSAQDGSYYVSGFSASTPRYGKPGAFHLLLLIPFLVFFLLNRAWSLKTAFFIGAFNIAFALRNFITLTGCAGGECPEKHPAIYGMLLCSILLVVFLLFVDIPGKRRMNTESPAKI